MKTTRSLFLTPIIKVVGDYCNNRCGYCFYHNNNQTIDKQMSLGVLESFLRQHIALVSGNLSFIWHGGEPLLIGLDFFKKIVSLQAELTSGKRLIRNSVQTNGTLITEEWAEFFKRNSFGVGVSLDGDSESHNLFRIDHNGQGTFSNTIRGIKILQKYGIKLSIIQTLTQANSNRVEQNLDFFVDKAQLSSLCINPYLDIDGNNKDMIGQSLSNDQLTQSMRKYIDFWFDRDDAKLRIREIDACLSGVFGRRARNCSYNGSCHSFYTLGHDGSVYPCDRLSGDSRFCFGKLSQKSLEEILTERKRKAFTQKSRKLPNDCILCELKNSCNNGCTAHRIGGAEGKYFFCQSRKEVHAYLRDKTQKVLGKKVQTRL